MFTPLPFIDEPEEEIEKEISHTFENDCEYEEETDAE